jgi:D-sedoheptulose 7-phosphate isomerase
MLDDVIANHMAVIRSLSAQRATLELTATDITRPVPAGEDIFWCGNAGSAADVWHLPAELVGRHKGERFLEKPLALPEMKKS